MLPETVLVWAPTHCHTVVLHSLLLDLACVCSLARTRMPPCSDSSEPESLTSQQQLTSLRVRPCSWLGNDLCATCSADTATKRSQTAL